MVNSETTVEFDIMSGTLKDCAETIGKREQTDEIRVRLKIEIAKIVKDLDYSDTVLVHRMLLRRGDIQKFFRLIRMLSKLL